MTYEDYTSRINPVYARYRNAVGIGCKLTAAARVRDMARLYAEYKGIPYGESLCLFSEKLHHDGFIPT